MSEKQQERGNFSSKIGFVLSAAGSAVGLGNIWRFPYVAAKNGGGLFLLVYLILVIFFGFSLMLVEIALGRKTRKGPIEAFASINKKSKIIGWLAFFAPVIILPYYSVIGGWVLKYLWTYITLNASSAATEGYFGGFISGSFQPIFWFLLFIGATTIITVFGVKKGIENVSKVLMPMLAILSVAIAVYSLTLNGAKAGVIYYLKPDFKNFTARTLLEALGQLFYSMSIAMGIMITFGSYMRKEDNMVSSVRQIQFFDTAIAFVSGLMIIPAVFAFSGGDEKALNSGPSLMFETMPKIFGGSNLIGCLFFLLVAFAALTSAISLMEVIVSGLKDKMNWSRKKSCLVVALVLVILGIPSSLGFGVWDSIKFFGMSILDFLDFVSNSVLMPIVALLTCVFAGWIVKPKFFLDEIKISSKFKQDRYFSIIVKYVGPVGIAAILIGSFI